MARFITILGFSVFFASIPIGLFLATLDWIGLESREPAWRLALAVLWGAAGGVALGLLWSTGLGLPLELLLTGEDRHLVETVFTVPLAEELAKGVVFVFLLRWRRIASPLVGLLHGVAAGLGFAMTENFAWFLHTWLQQGDQAWFLSVVLRTFFSGILHAAATGVWGAALGLAMANSRPWVGRLVPYAGLVAALALHGGWNLAFTLSGVTGEALPAGVGLLSVPIVVAVMIGLAWACMQWERRVIRAELAAEERAGHLPENHARILARPRTRRQDGWLPDGADRRRYVRTAMSLVTLRRNVRADGGDPDAGDHEGVQALREALRRELDDESVS